MFKLLKSSLFFGLLLTFLVCTAHASENSFIKKNVLEDLNCLYHMFAAKYAPKPWKKEFAGWDLEESIAVAKNKVENHPNLTAKESQIILRDFFNSTKDYHVGVTFFSTESATLPFLVKGAEKRYFVCFVDRDKLSKREFPFDQGDELLSFGGRPIHEVVEELRLREYGSNTLETDQALAEMSLTRRWGMLGQLIPSGKVEITGIQKGSGKKLSATLTWRYTPEKVRDYSKLPFNVGVETLISDEIGQPYADLQSFFRESQFFKKHMVPYFWNKSSKGIFSEMREHSLGSRSSFIPALGKKIWNSGTDALFDAYIFEAPSGKKIGYIRIPHYTAGAEEVEEFGLTMNFFQKRTDALIIDQLNNPGGSIFYLNALASTLTNKPLNTSQERFALTQKEVFDAHFFLPYLEQVNSDETARIVMGDTLDGYPIDYRFVRFMKQYCNFMIKQWEEGKLLSDPTFLLGFNGVYPHPKYCYSKPIMVLINSLDFSCGDFFPALLQDNKRALIFGTRTAGAGGYVFSIDYPNHSGMKYFSMTGSIAERTDQKPIENLGVTPDIQYDLKPSDLQNNYEEYVSAILETIESIASKS